MSEWWSYDLQDLLLFSPRTYYRLFELYNLELWPLQLLALALGVAVMVLLRRGGERAGRAIALILAVSWLWVAWGFHWQRYASINWAAQYFALAFAFESLLLLWLGVRDRIEFTATSRIRRYAGLAIFLFALLVFPWMGTLLGRGWAQAEVFGMTPDATALATLGILALSNWRAAAWLWPIPLAWCLISGATLWAMDSPDYAVAPSAALIAVALAFGGKRQRCL